MIDAPPAVAFVASVVVLDFAIWLQHVACHKIAALWRLHRMHHADLDIDLTTGIRFHPVEILLSMLWKVAWVLALGAPAAAVVAFEAILNACNDAGISPRDIDGLVRYPYALYPRYEAQAALTRAALHPEVFHRIRDTLARKRWESIRILFATHAPQADPHARERAAANVRFFLAATAWNYYRSYFGMDLEEAMEAVSDAIGHIVQGLKP